MHSETKHDHQKPAVILQSRLSVDPGETRFITIPEAVELDFNSFIPQADITSQVHFFSNIRAESKAHSAGLTDGDRILQVNGVNVTHLEHEDVRRLLQLVTPLVLTVAHDPKYLAVLQQPVEHAEEKAPELPIRSTQYAVSDGVHPDQPGDLVHGEPLKAKVCRLQRSDIYDGYGLVLKFQHNMHVIGEVESASPSYDAGLRHNDVIIFVGKKNVEELTHEDVKVMIRAMSLALDHVELTVLPKGDLPKYKTLRGHGPIDRSMFARDT